MANSNHPYGLRPVRHLTGGEVRTNTYKIASTYGTSIFTGDPVIGINDGTIGIGTDGQTATLGVFAGCRYVDAAGNVKFSAYWPASTTATNIEAYVYDDPYIVFAIQSDATGVAATDINIQADYKIVAGNTTTGQSKVVLDCASGLAATGKNLRILRLVDDGENAAGAYADVEVVFAEHALKGVVAGVGGV